jgi:hypothetical protein
MGYIKIVTGRGREEGFDVLTQGRSTSSVRKRQQQDLATKGRKTKNTVATNFRLDD